MTTKRICDEYSINSNNPHPHNNLIVVAEFSISIRETNDNGFVNPPSVNQDLCRECFQTFLDHLSTGGFRPNTEITMNRD